MSVYHKSDHPNDIKTGLDLLNLNKRLNDIKKQTDMDDKILQTTIELDDK